MITKVVDFANRFNDKFWSIAGPIILMVMTIWFCCLMFYITYSIFEWTAHIMKG
jgi:hypothetical protein